MLNTIKGRVKSLLKNKKGAAEFVAVIVVLGLTVAAGIVVKNYFTKKMNDTMNEADSLESDGSITRIPE